MFNTVVYSVGFFVALTVIGECKEMKMQLPRQVEYLEMQCIARGYPGACKNFNFYQGQLECEDLACAKPVGRHRFKVAYTGRVADGTKCGRNKICIKGSCEKIAADAMPRQIENGAEYTCFTDKISEKKK